MEDTNQTLEHEGKKKSSKKISPYTIALIFILITHFTVQLIFFQPASSGRDTHGYTMQAKMIAEHGRVWIEKEHPLQFAGDHWFQLNDDDNRLMSRYPPGLPVFYAILYKFFGTQSVFLFNHVLATLSVLGLYLLCRFWTQEFCALAAVLVMSTNPVVNSWAPQADSHFLVAFFLVWGLYCLAHWAKTFSVPYAILAGLMLGWIPTIRYAETIYAPAIAIYLLLHCNWTKKYWISFTAAVLSASLPLTVLSIHNLLVFGSILVNGYTTDPNTTMFAIEFFLQKFFPYLSAIHIRGLGWFATLGFIGFFTLVHFKATRKEGILLAGIAIPALMLYMAYFFFDGSQRFLLPTYYLYVTAGVWCFHLLIMQNVKGAKLVLIILTVSMAVWCSVTSVKHTQRFYTANKLLAAATETIQKAIGSNEAFVIVPHRLGSHLQFTTGYHLIDVRLFQPQDTTSTIPIDDNQNEENTPRRPTAPLRGMGTKERERFQKLRDYYWSDNKELSPVFLQDLTQWSNNKTEYYWIGEQHKIIPMLPAQDSHEIIATFDLVLDEPPSRPPQQGGRGRAGNETSNNPDRAIPQSQRPGIYGLFLQHPRGNPRERREEMLRRNQMKPATVSVIKWIHNDNPVYE